MFTFFPWTPPLASLHVSRENLTANIKQLFLPSIVSYFAPLELLYISLIPKNTINFCGIGNKWVCKDVSANTVTVPNKALFSLSTHVRQTSIKHPRTYVQKNPSLKFLGSSTLLWKPSSRNPCHSVYIFVRHLELQWKSFLVSLTPAHFGFINRWSHGNKQSSK